jgi:hypothetical protein
MCDRSRLAAMAAKPICGEAQSLFVSIEAVQGNSFP